MTRVREVIEGPQYQGKDEEIVWTLDIRAWGVMPTNITVTVYDEAGTDVTAIVMTGSPTTPTTTTIALPLLHSLTPDTQYRVEVQFDAGAQTLEGYFIIIAED